MVVSLLVILKRDVGGCQEGELNKMRQLTVVCNCRI
jgi:hypothetical protein